MTVYTLQEYPADSGGNLVRYARERDKTFTWAPNQPMDLTLRLLDIEKTGVGHRFIWVDQHGRRWGMFATDFTRTAKKTRMTYGVVEGTWIVSRRGQAYSLSPYLPGDTHT